MTLEHERLLTINEFGRLSLAEQTAYLARSEPASLSHAELKRMPADLSEDHVQLLLHHSQLRIAHLYAETRQRIASGEFKVPDSLARSYGIKRPRRKKLKPNLDIDAAIERAHQQVIAHAQRTPQRLWTAEMRQAMRTESERGSRERRTQ
jgi:hypothetical protein